MGRRLLNFTSQMMCRCGNVQMCRWGKSPLVVIVLFVMLSVSGYSQSSGSGSNQFYLPKKFIDLLIFQRCDSIPSLLSEEIRHDSIVKANICTACTYVSKGSTSMHWICKQTGSSSFACHYVDRDQDNKTRLLIILTYGEGAQANMIVAVKVFDEAQLTQPKIGLTPNAPSKPK